MRRVLAVHSPEYLNQWLEKFKDALLIDVKPVSPTNTAVLAIVEFPDDTKRIIPGLHINSAIEKSEEKDVNSVKEKSEKP